MMVKYKLKGMAMKFTSSNKNRILILMGVILVLGISIALEMSSISLVSYVALIWSITYVTETYLIQEKCLVKKVFKNTLTIPLDSITHIRRVYGMAEEDTRDRSAMYFISDGCKYIKLNKLPKNSHGQTVVDILLDEYHIPIRNEKDYFFVNTKLDKNETKSK